MNKSTKNKNELALTKKLNEANLKLSKVCEAYQIARPMLQFISKVLIIKPKWKLAAEALIATLDNICNPLK